MNYCQYEIPSAKTLEELLTEAYAAEQFVLHNHLQEAKKLSDEMGLKNLIVHEEFPVLLAAIGYTRAKKNPGEALLRPFASNPSNASKNKIPIPVTHNKNEAVMFSLESRRLLAWLCVNNWITKPSRKMDEITATAYLYKQLRLYGMDVYDLTAELETMDPESPALLTFELLHTFTHALIQAGKKYIGLDTDSLSEYLFPSTQTAAIYVAKHHEFSLGALVATFKHNLTRWLKASQEVSASCLYDPVCITGNGACHACTYLKFSCRHFNRGLNRVLLVGGYYKPLSRHICGYFSSEVTRIKETL